MQHGPQKWRRKRERRVGYSDVVVVVVVVVLGSSAILFLVSAARFPLAAFSRKIQKRRESRSVPFILSLSLSLEIWSTKANRPKRNLGPAHRATVRRRIESNRIASHRIESQRKSANRIVVAFSRLFFFFLFSQIKKTRSDSVGHIDRLRSAKGETEGVSECSFVFLSRGI